MIVIWFLVVYLFLLFLLFVYQRQLVFRPSLDDPFLHSNRPFKKLIYMTPEGLKLRGLWHPPADNQPTIIYFHGTAGNINDRLFKARLFIKRGYGIALVGYHGYDGNPGFPTEQNLYDDGRAAIRAILKKGVSFKQVILYGESLGTGIATQMAAENPDVMALVLEAPYTSIADVAAARFWYFPVRRLIRDKFESFKKIHKLKMPVLIIHGTKDRTVPHPFGKRLFGMVTAKKKEFISLEGASHTDLYDFGAEEALHAFIQRIQ